MNCAGVGRLGVLEDGGLKKIRLLRCNLVIVGRGRESTKEGQGAVPQKMATGRGG